MAYSVEQKIGKNTYVYQAKSYWDKEKKQARQKREYLGKKDPQTGEVAKVRGSFRPKYARDWGNIYLVHEVAERVKLIDVLKEVYPDRWKELLYLAMYEVIERRPLYLFKAWAESACIERISDLSSQRISEFMGEIGKDGGLREKFQESWIGKQRDLSSIIFDITSLSSHSKLIEELEWGYNRDGESLPQINLGVTFGESSCLPLFYNIYPGSIKDVSTFENILTITKSLGIKKSLFVMDKGFYSKTNLLNMKGKIGFLIPLPFSTKLSKILITRHYSALSSPLNSFVFGKRVLFYVRDKVEVGGTKAIAHIYMNEEKRATELNSFLKKILALEEKVKGQKWEKGNDIKEYMEDIVKGSAKFFYVSVRRGAAKIRRNEETLSSFIERMGKTILVTSKSALGREEALQLYRRKDYIESLFDTLKNELKDKRLRVHSSEVMEGRLFVSFLSLIIHSAIGNIMREQKLFKNYTMLELLLELKKLKIVEMENKKTYLTEVSKKQRQLFGKFDISMPEVT